MTLTFVRADFVITSDDFLVKYSSHYNRHIQESANMIINLPNYLQTKQEEQKPWYIVACHVHKPQTTRPFIMTLASVHPDTAAEHSPTCTLSIFSCFFLSLSCSQPFLWAQMLLSAAKSMRAWLSREAQEEKRRQLRERLRKRKKQWNRGEVNVKMDIQNLQV